MNYTISREKQVISIGVLMTALVASTALDRATISFLTAKSDRVALINDVLYGGTPPGILDSLKKGMVNAVEDGIGSASFDKDAARQAFLDYTLEEFGEKNDKGLSLLSLVTNVDLYPLGEGRAIERIRFEQEKIENYLNDPGGVVGFPVPLIGVTSAIVTRDAASYSVEDGSEAYHGNVTWLHPFSYDNRDGDKNFGQENIDWLNKILVEKQMIGFVTIAGQGRFVKENVDDYRRNHKTNFYTVGAIHDGKVLTLGADIYVDADSDEEAVDKITKLAKDYLKRTKQDNSALAAFLKTIIDTL